MNVFIAHAQILRKEPPKEPGRSGLMVLKVGKNKRTTDALWARIDKVRLAGWLGGWLADCPGVHMKKHKISV